MGSRYTRAHRNTQGVYKRIPFTNPHYSLHFLSLTSVSLTSLFHYSPEKKKERPERFSGVVVAGGTATPENENNTFLKTLYTIGFVFSSSLRIRNQFFDNKLHKP
jgi:hypothetical protein